jgi:chaperonin cofactor prefoldin
MIFKQNKTVLRLLDRTERLEHRIDELHSQNLKLIEMIGHLKDEIAWLKYQNFIANTKQK